MEKTLYQMKQGIKEYFNVTVEHLNTCLIIKQKHTCA